MLPSTSTDGSTASAAGGGGPGTIGAGAMTFAREKHWGAPPSLARQQTSIWPPLGTCQPSGHGSLQYGGSPPEPTIASQISAGTPEQQA
ncbi:MAG TPA: hypothetical protein VN894_16405 [Polyangiaceae bacterium]|nr:hypothetical protein [Polyangiaceae bacterium]